MNELFIINDYDTKQPMMYYLTDNAYECKKVLEDIDALDKGEEIFITYHWLEIFEKECANRGIKIKPFERIAHYNY